MRFLDASTIGFFFKDQLVEKHMKLDRPLQGGGVHSLSIDVEHQAGGLIVFRFDGNQAELQYGPDYEAPTHEWVAPAGNNLRSDQNLDYFSSMGPVRVYGIIGESMAKQESKEGKDVGDSLATHDLKEDKNSADANALVKSKKEFTKVKPASEKNSLNVSFDKEPAIAPPKKIGQAGSSVSKGPRTRKPAQKVAEEVPKEYFPDSHVVRNCALEKCI